MRTPTEPWKLRPLRVSSSTHKDRDSFYTRHVVQLLYDWAINVQLIVLLNTCLPAALLCRPAAAFQTEYLGGLFTPILFLNVIIATIIGVWIEKQACKLQAIQLFSIEHKYLRLLWCYFLQIQLNFWWWCNSWTCLQFVYSLWSDKEK